MATTAFYAFFLNMWMMKRISEETLLTKVPKYLKQTEYDMIIATPQIEV